MYIRHGICFAIIITANVVHVMKTTSEIVQIELWQDEPPNGPGPSGPERVTSTGIHSNIAKPRLIVHTPENPNGAAMLVISGGGYKSIELGKEGTPASRWLVSIGVTAFELVYRLPSEGWSSVDVPFQDGQRAIRLIRNMATKLSIHDHKIGIMGFSAGGHLAGLIQTEPANRFYTPTDSYDRLSARPDFAALLYPVITMLPPYNNTHAEEEILGKHSKRRQQEHYSVQLHVNDQTPPTFVAHALDDPIANVENSKLMFGALRKYNVTAELHLFTTGGHGWGLGLPGTPEHVWPKLFEIWAKVNGFFKNE
ncbi:acetylxylan esterase-like [Bradysia coprophila]|uniref:acetylxylan esterase-like n=1 Tax=Bradysia coprophila TaxID=38358 RepID=UPI00187DBB60|nr:acetylxylan esterase-like [Bradysia coprophila]